MQLTIRNSVGNFDCTNGFERGVKLEDTCWKYSSGVESCSAVLGMQFALLKVRARVEAKTANRDEDESALIPL